MNKISTLLAAAILSATLAMAQAPRAHRFAGGPFEGRRASAIASRLELTDAQKAQSKQIFEQASTSGESARAELKSLHKSLREAVKNNDTGTIDRLSVNMGTLNGQLAASRMKAQAAFYALLTPEQKAKYDAASERRGSRAAKLGKRMNRQHVNP